jgi:hypothetical protein
MRSATFRNVGLGCLALTAAYCLGFHQASAQSALFRVIIPGGGVVCGGQFYGFDLAQHRWAIGQPGSEFPPVAPSSLVSAGGGVWLTEDGTAWWPDGYGWHSTPGPCGATEARRQSFGQIKAKYAH